MIEGGLKGKEEKKPAICHHFAFVMLEFETMKVFFFLNVTLNLKHHWNDSTSWVMAECLHKQVLNKMQEIVASSRYFVFFYDEVTTIDNQSWISIPCYIVQNWCHLPVLIF